MKTPATRLRGFSLVEVTLALGVAGFCLVTVMGLLPLGLDSNQNCLEQTLAASVASQVYSDLRLAPRTPNAASPRYGIVIPSPLSSGATTTMLMTAEGVVTASGSSTASSATASDPSRFKVSISFIPPPPPAAGQGALSPASLPPGQSTMVQILVTWPPMAAPSNASGAFEAMSALDRG
jgi:Tfp pilus assembly protein PilV